MTSQSIALSTASGFGIVSPVTTGKFMPDLYGVANGTYNSITDNNYGVCQPVQPAMDGLVPVDYFPYEFTGSATIGPHSVQGNSFCNWTKDPDNVVSFDLCISLLGLQTDPFANQGLPYELKVRPLPTTLYDPQQYGLRGLPLPDPAQDSPVFDAEFVTTPYVNPATGPRGRYLPTGTTFFRARLLKDGTFALIYVSGASLQTDVPFPSSGGISLFTTVLFPTYTNGGAANLHIRGKYFSGNNYY